MSAIKPMYHVLCLYIVRLKSINQQKKVFKNQLLVKKCGVRAVYTPTWNINFPLIIVKVFHKCNDEIPARI